MNKDNAKRPVVSVRLMTYNHEKFIHQAMESILSQKVDFPVEVVVGDDFSTDNTLSIIRKFKSTKSIHIHILERAKGDEYWKKRQAQGRIYNFINILENCKGKYIALLDGDDYWTDPLKLQKQVDFLEENKNYSGVATNSLIKFEGTDKERLFRTNLKSILETNDLLEARHFHTATFMYRREAFKPDFPVKVLSADRTLFMLVSCIGPIRLLDDVTAVYRKNDGGISTKVTSKQMKQDYKIVDYIKKYSNDFDSLKLKIFITKTVLEYSHKIYFIDFINAAC